MRMRRLGAMLIAGMVTACATGRATPDEPAPEVPVDTASAAGNDAVAPGSPVRARMAVAGLT